MADCRKCIHFVPPDQLGKLDYWEYEKAESMRFHYPSEFLGWCRRWHKMITYYVGKCRYYTPKQARNDLTITQFLAGVAEE